MRFLNAHLEEHKKTYLFVSIALIAAAICALMFFMHRNSLGGRSLSFSPPTLHAPQLVHVGGERRDLRLDANRDYKVVFDSPITSPDGLVISGGHNVVLIGGQIEPGVQVKQDAVVRGLYLRDQTGTIHVEGIHIAGNNLQEGIDLSQTKGATVQLANITIDEIHGQKKGAHADLLQAWAGPKTLRVDRFQGTSNYQGFFLLPSQHNDSFVPLDWSLRRVHINLTGNGGYGLWKQDGLPVALNDVVVTAVSNTQTNGTQPELAKKIAWPSLAAWPGVEFGPASEVNQSVVTGNPGMNYKSPGYRFAQ